jgi:hypothetical protein
MCKSAGDKPLSISTGALLVKRIVHDKQMRMGVAGKPNEIIGPIYLISSEEHIGM